MERYETAESLSFAHNVREVIRATQRGSNLPVVLKREYHSSADSLNRVFCEMLNQQSIGDGGVCYIYDCFLSQENSLKVTTLVLESMRTDLLSEVRRRKPSGELWKETELWKYAKTIVRVLARAQQKNICHRDIKPENLFLATNGDVKIGDFGLSKRIHSLEDSQTLCGTQPYFSPALREAYIQGFREGITDMRIKHNSYKSDVYALGMTLLVLAKLEIPQELSILQELQQKIDAEVQSIPYSPEFKQLLSRMLSTIEDNRPDFTEMEKILSDKSAAPPEAFGNYPPVCQCGVYKEWINSDWACPKVHNS